MFGLQKKTLLFEQHNEHFAIDCENSKCPPPAFTHAFNLLVKFLTARRVDGKLSQITCSACLSLATDFSFGEKYSMNTTQDLKKGLCRRCL